MNIHLVRSSEYPAENFWQVVDLLGKYPGVLRFKHREDPLVIDDAFISRELVEKDNFLRQEEPPHGWFKYNLSYSNLYPPESRSVVKWNDLFRYCREYRRKYDIGDDEFVVLLTGLSNEQNWFAAGDPEGRRDIFVHTAYWDYFTGSDHRYPVAYHVVTVVLKRMLFRDFDDLNSHWHHKPVGCMMDFCRNKAHIALKLRTGDICPSCLKLLESRGVDHGLISQVFSVMEGIRAQMIWKDRFPFHHRSPELRITGWNKKFIFPELGDLEIRLTPLEKALYLLFVAHPDGFPLNAVHDHRQELGKIYDRLSNADSREMINSRVMELANPLSNSASEKISRIRRKFNETLGEQMAADFLIQGGSGEVRYIPAARASGIIESD